jgi:aquaporin Z
MSDSVATSEGSTPVGPTRGRIVLAEAIGTTILMLGGPGTAIIGINLAGGGVLAVSLGFGFALLIAAYAIGHVSGCHINPAVTFGLWLVKKLDGALVPVYLLGQVLGAVIGGGLIWLIASGRDGGFDASPATFATNLWDEAAGFGGFWPMVLVEVVLTAVLVFVVLSTTRAGYLPAVSGVHAGITLALIHMISIPIDNTSVNPARSLGTAVFAGGDALEQLWAFVAFPLIGAGFGGLLWVLLEGSDGSEETAGLDLPEREGLAGGADAASA